MIKLILGLYYYNYLFYKVSYFPSLLILILQKLHEKWILNEPPFFRKNFTYTLPTPLERVFPMFFQRARLAENQKHCPFYYNIIDSLIQEINL